MSVINGFRKKSALHRRRFGPFRTDPQPLWEFQAQAMQKSRLGRIRTHGAPQAQLPSVRRQRANCILDSRGLLYFSLQGDRRNPCVAWAVMCF